MLPLEYPVHYFQSQGRNPGHRVGEQTNVGDEAEQDTDYDPDRDPDYVIYELPLSDMVFVAVTLVKLDLPADGLDRCAHRNVPFRCACF